MFSLDPRRFGAVRSCDWAENGFQLHFIIPPTSGNERDGSAGEEELSGTEIK